MDQSFPIITSEQMADVDREAVNNGLSITQMMEYAGLGCARIMQKFEGSKILILVGKGHNGGDGLAAARHLINWGYDVKILMAESPEDFREASKTHYDLLKKMGVNIEIWGHGDEQKDYFKNCDLIMDALLGYNINGDPRGHYKFLIEEANISEKVIVAIDIPSGLEGSTGKPNNPTIKANTTLTLALPKKGLIESKHYVGELYISDLGIPDFVYKKAGINVPAGLFKKNSIVKFN